MSVLAFMILLWVFGIARVRRRRRVWGMYGVGAWPGYMCQRGWLRRAGEQPGLAAPPTDVQAVRRESAFDLLKKRYVSGQLNDDQYERELDALLRTPEGRAQVQ